MIIIIMKRLIIFMTLKHTFQTNTKKEKIKLLPTVIRSTNF